MITLTLLLLLATQDHATCPMHAKHMAAAKADGSAEHGKEVDHRHDSFGMPHTGSTHSFRLFADGGAIELRANREGDAETVTAIRNHLQEIDREFDQANFKTPMFVHDKTPAGVEDMARLKSDLSYDYQELAAGGRIRITAKSPAALAAVHEFLRFQVVEHRTANSGKVEQDQ